ncbi:FxSxx-COOH system tetratricopeptide repeat protein [Micromonospora sp. WMMD1082]|uniref:FxSxx-COOH system tetratricopeptide repeat protein n=1 Tax=Micromonospora sp. WMMD1082 TaxID=3016104 RepID=UPI002417924C|nr:FxSxx-COOH system tetratricopeptide repeat protein [Micromonospora sp. WMMD1082]MDG4797558.1 FxSxx-COOH system tetratricopeptide repeat protein [Micromonospora sp. WMMD1082]
MATTDREDAPVVPGDVPQQRPARDRAGPPGRDETVGSCTIVSFVSPTSGTGRSSAVANIAWILASHGKRVLAVDWCTKTPRVYDYLRSFRVDAVPAAGVLGAELAALISPHPDPPVHRASVAAPTAPEQGVLYQYAISGSSFGFAMIGISLDVNTLPEVDPVRARQLLRHGGYDYVLIDTPVDLTLPGISYTAMLSDVAVVSIPPRRQAMQQAADLAGQLLREATGGIRVLAAPTLRDVSQPWYGAARDSARKAFANLLDESIAGLAGASAVEIVEVPEQAYDTYDDVLAVLADTPGSENTLLAAYEQMASWISGGAVARAADVPERIRRRYRRGVLLDRAESADEIHVLYEPVDRPFADWIGGQLRRANAQVQPHAVRSGVVPAYGPDATVLAILSRGVVQALGTGLTAAQDTDVELFGVLTSGDAPEQLDPSRVIDLRAVDGARAQPLLLSRLGLIAPAQPTGDLRTAPRYPAEAERRLRTNLPPRNESFVGRGEYLERLRDQLADGGGPVTLTGGAGVGKSEIAREFAHRFAYDYDVVWWIPAQDRETVQAALGELAQEINVADSVGAAEAAVAALSAPRGAIARWLLIYDNADDAEVLAGLLPRTGAGHVLFTSRDDGSSNLPAPLEVAAFTGDESTAMLRWTLGISAEDARAIAAAVEHLPLALRLATAWIRERTRALEREGVPNLEAVGRCVAELLDWLRRPAGEEEPAERIPGSRTSTVARVLDITLDTLRDVEFGPLAIRVAELGAFLSPEGIGFPLLRSVPMLTQLATAAGIDPEELLLDAGEIDLVLTVGARFALFDIDWGRGAALRMHRAIQVLLREAMPEPQRRERHRQVLRGLAGYAPTDPEADDRRYIPVFEELQRHLVPSGALTAEEASVRHWVVKQVRYLFFFGDSDAWQSAVRLAQQVCDRWTATGDFDQLTMRLFVQTANLHRVLGKHQEALRLDERVLSEQRRRHGLRHFRTLIVGRGRGGDLRGLGRFEEARVEDQATLLGYQEVLGDDHPNTLMAINNLAIAFQLTGDAREALRLAHQLLARWMSLFGPEEPATWRASCLVGTLEREAGECELSLVTLRETLERVHELRSASHLDELRVNRSLAVTERRLGLAIAAKKRSIETFRGYRDRFGEDHPITRASLLSMAVDYYRAGDAGIAVEHAIRCLRGYERQLETGHPFTAVCSVNLGLFQRGAGEYDQAVRDGERGLRTLRARLGDTHPWTLTATTAQAGHLAARGDLTDAVRIQEDTYHTCLRYLGRRHPCTVDAEANRVAIRALREGANGADAIALTDTDIDVPRS